MAKTKMHALLDVGQSVWLDYLRRGMTRSGELSALIDDGLRGMTSNPTIFEQALAGADYDDELAELSSSPGTERDLFEVLSVEDVREAADVFRRVYDSSQGGSVTEARRLWKAVDRPNVMIKIPGTREGWPAIERCLRDGININITLLFSLEHYKAVVEAYLRALEARVERGQPIDRLASVASFFVSRVDTEVDKRIQALGGPLLDLRGKVAIAGARLAFAMFLEITGSERWRKLEANGARKQRLLWASTGTKNREYSDVLYVESLIGPDTVATVPVETLRLFEDHGVISQTLNANTLSDARRVMDALAAGGIDFGDVNSTLEREGVEKFVKSFDSLLGLIAQKRRSLAR